MMWGSPPEPPSATNASLRTDVEQLKGRVASTETALQRHIAAADAAISALNARVDALAGGGVAVSAVDNVTTVNIGGSNDLGAQANDPDRKSSQTSAPNRLSQGESRDQAYPLKQSTWDSLILVFLPGSDVSPIDSTVATLLFVANVIIQFLFTMIIVFQATNLKNDKAGEKFHSDALAWRLGIGHHVNNYDPVTNTSLVTRVCTDYGAEVISKAQMDVYKAINEYLNGNEDFSMGTGHGPLLSFLAVLIWTAGIGSELRDNWQFLSAVFSLKRGSTACVPKIAATGDRSYALRSLSTSRLFVVVMASMTRFAIAVGLWYAGMLWLTHTIEMNEIILNAVALGFVLEFDELFYQLVPREVDVVLQNLEPLPMNSRRHRLQHRWFTIFDMRSLILVILLCVTMATWSTTWSRDFRMQLQTSRHLFCSGDTNFVYLEDPATHVVNAAMTLPEKNFKSAFKLDTSKPQLFDAVLQRTNLMSEATELENVERLFDSLEGVQEPLYKPEIVSEVELLLVRDATYAIDLLACADTDTTLAYRTGMKSALGFDNCNDAVQYMGCSWQVRTFCPVACNCHIVDSGIFKRFGCTSQCDARHDLSQSLFEADVEKRGAGCVDNPLESRDSGRTVWDFVSELQEHLFDKGYLENRDDQTVFTDSFKQTFNKRNDEMWELEDDYGVNITHWLYRELEDDESDCTWVLYFDTLFGTNLCEADLVAGFGTLAPFCARTCAWCNNPKPTVETHLMAKDLRQLLGFDVITPILAEALTDAVDLENQVCTRTGGANFQLSSSTVGASDAVANPGLERVFNFTAQHTGQYTIRVTGLSSYDTILSMWSGSTFQVLHMNDDAYSLDPCFKVDINGGDQIVLVVEGYQWNTEGRFELAVECPWFEDGWHNEGCPLNPGVSEDFDIDTNTYDLREVPCKSAGLHRVPGYDCAWAADELGLRYTSIAYASYAPTGCSYDSFNQILYIEGTGSSGTECGETFQCICTEEEVNQTYNAYPTACDQATWGPCKVCVEQVDSYCALNSWDQMCKDQCNLICEPVCEVPAFNLTSGPCNVTTEVSVEHMVEEWCLSSDSFKYENSSYSPNTECVFTLGLKEHELKFYEPFWVDYFVTDVDGGDYLLVNGEEYSGENAPQDVLPTGTITWTSDYGNSDLLWYLQGGPPGFGWRICAPVIKIGCVDTQIDGAVNQLGQSCADMAKDTWICDASLDDDDFAIMRDCCHCGGGQTF